MSSLESDSPSSNPSFQPAFGETSVATEEMKSIDSGRLALFLAMGGILAALLSWISVEMALNVYHDQIFPKLKPIQDQEDARKLLTARVACGRLAYMAMGAIVPLSLGAAAGLARRSSRTAVLAAVSGAILGAGLGAGASSVVIPIFYKNWDPSSFDMALPLLTHGALWGSVGAAAGLAIGLGVGLGGGPAALKALFGGLFGALAATAIYEVAGAVAFPTSKTELPISNSLVTRAIAPMLVVALTAVGALVTRTLSFTRPKVEKPDTNASGATA